VKVAFSTRRPSIVMSARIEAGQLGPPGPTVARRLGCGSPRAAGHGACAAFSMTSTPTASLRAKTPPKRSRSARRRSSARYVS
jgi:hypothetical protein